MRSLIFGLVLVGMLCLPATVNAKDGEGLQIPPGFVVMVSLFDTGDPSRMGVTYDLGVITDTHSILSARRAVMAHGDADKAMLAYRIIILTSSLEVIEGATHDCASNSQSAIIATGSKGALPVNDPPTKVIYGYSPDPGDKLTGLLLVSEDNEPMQVENLTLEPLIVEQGPVELTDDFGISLPKGSYYALRISSDKQIEGPLPLRDIHNGFVLNKDGCVVGLLLERDADGALFLVPLVAPAPNKGAAFYIRK